PTSGAGPALTSLYALAVGFGPPVVASIVSAVQRERTRRRRSGSREKRHPRAERRRGGERTLNQPAPRAHFPAAKSLSISASVRSSLPPWLSTTRAVPLGVTHTSRLPRRNTSLGPPIRHLPGRAARLGAWTGRPPPTR